MWHNSRRGFNLIRNRANARNNRLKKIELTVIASLILLISTVAIYGTYKLVSNAKVTNTASNNVEENASVNIYIEENIVDKAEKEDKIDNLETEIVETVDKTDESSTTMKITALGEIMMGGKTWQDNSYSLSFKEIASYTTNSDYTIASLATNITSVEELIDTKSKYIANQNIINAFSALNIDALNVATDHMLDFSKNMFNSTIELLKNNDVNIIGLENDIVYAEKDGIRAAIIGINNVVIGSVRDYIDAGMYIYDLAKLKNSIAEARTKADTVIVMTHYGKENVHEVTDVMRWFAREIVNAGADIVLGGHSIGIYPIEEYNGKLIIYSLGYLMHDTNNEIGKKSAIFDISVSIEGKIEEVSILPTYIENKKAVKLYKDINESACSQFLDNLKNKSELSCYSAIVENDKLVVKLNK